MKDWQQKQAKFDQLPIDVEAINSAIMHLNQLVMRGGASLNEQEQDMRVLVMLVSRVEKCVQEQTKALNEVRDLMIESFGKGKSD